MPKPLKLHFYIVFHRYILDQCYSELDTKYLPFFTFVGVNDTIEKQYSDTFAHCVLKESQFPIFDPSMQADKFCESSVWLHLYRNSAQFVEPYDFIGCFHYDMSFTNEFLHYINTVWEIDHPGDTDVVFYFQLEYGLDHFGSTVKNNVTGVYETFTHIDWSMLLLYYNKYFGTNHEYCHIVHDMFPGFHSFLLHKAMFYKLASFIDRILPWVREKLQGNFQHMPFTLETIWGLLLLLQKRENPRLKFIKLRGIRHDEHLKDNWRPLILLPSHESASGQSLAPDDAHN